MTKSLRLLLTCLLAVYRRRFHHHHCQVRCNYQMVQYRTHREIVGDVFALSLNHSSLRIAPLVLTNALPTFSTWFIVGLGVSDIISKVSTGA